MGQVSLTGLCKHELPLQEHKDLPQCALTLLWHKDSKQCKLNLLWRKTTISANWLSFGTISVQKLRGGLADQVSASGDAPAPAAGCR